jgi:RimJ/RimL family protein N-acetyltransferase
LYKKLGFKLEGKKRDFILWEGKFYDELLMGMLAKEWDGGRTG